MRAWLVLVAVAACGKVPAPPASDANPGGDFTVAIAAPSGLLRRGSTVTATVTIARTTGFSGDVSLAGNGLPTSITFDPLTIANPATTGTLTLHADPTTTEGAQMLMFDGASGQVVHTASVSVTVAGAPGTFDESFGTAGKFSTGLGANALVGRGVTITPDGGMVAVGVNLGMSQTVLVKVNSAGTLDANFGSGGIVTTGAGSFAEGIAITQTSGGKLVVGGVANGNGTSDDNFGVFQYTSAGALDTTFASSGVASFDPNTSTFAEVHTVAVLGDGSIVASGTDFGSATNGHELHYSASGTLDSAFDIIESGVNIEASVVQADGKLVAVGGVGSPGSLWIARYNATGGHDAGFGTGGVTTTSIGSSGDTLFGVVALSGGKLLGVGTTGCGSGCAHVVIVRYNANGSLDLTFGTNGIVTTTVAMTTLSPNAATTDAAGKIYFAGASSSKPAIARFNADGSVDSTFGTSGVTTIDFGVTGSNAQTGAYGVQIDSIGRIVISADVGPASGQRLGIARLWP